MIISYRESNSFLPLSRSRNKSASCKLLEVRNVDQTSADHHSMQDSKPAHSKPIHSAAEQWSCIPGIRAQIKGKSDSLSVRHASAPKNTDAATENVEVLKHTTEFDIIVVRKYGVFQAQVLNHGPQSPFKIAGTNGSDPVEALVWLLHATCGMLASHWKDSSDGTISSWKALHYEDSMGME